MHSPVERVLEQLTLVVGGRREGDSLRPDRLTHPSSHRPKLARWLCVIWYPGNEIVRNRCALPSSGLRKLTGLPKFLRVPSAGLAATPGVRSMAPSKRRKTSAVSQPASGNASSGVRTRRSASARGDLPDAPDADLDAEPEELMCPITRTMFRDPVFVSIRGTRTRGAPFCRTFERNGAKDPLTRRALSSTKVMTNWAMRNVVQAWLDKHPGVTPDGWDSRELLEPSKDDGTRTFDDEGDVGVLRTWRAMCPELQERWPEDEQPEDWEGVTMENGRVVKLVLEEFGLTGAVPAEIGRLSALRSLDLGDNQLTSLPAEIGQLTSLEELSLSGNQLTSVPAEIGQLTSLRGWTSAAIS